MLIPLRPQNGYCHSMAQMYGFCCRACFTSSCIPGAALPGVCLISCAPHCGIKSQLKTLATFWKYSQDSIRHGGTFAVGWEGRGVLLTSVQQPKGQREMSSDLFFSLLLNSHNETQETGHQCMLSLSLCTSVGLDSTVAYKSYIHSCSWCFGRVHERHQNWDVSP